MTEQELVERIAQEGASAYFQQWDTLTEGQRANWQKWVSDQIMPSIKEALPELAKEAGYAKPPESMEITELAEAIENFKMGIKEIKGTVQSFLLTNHYVRLDEDQTLPHILIVRGDAWSYEQVDRAQVKMFKLGWRKVKLA